MSAQGRGAKARRGIPLAVASNRGPVSYTRREDGSLEARGGVGGLVRVLGGALRGRRATWVAVTLGDEDREMVKTQGGRVTVELEGAPVEARIVPIDPETQNLYYNEFANRILWFVHHFVWNVSAGPDFGPGETDAWDAYRTVNARMAEVLAQETAPGAVVLPQDYHLALLGTALRERRDDLRLSHFWHIPFAQPDQYRILPDAWGAAMLEGMLACDVVGFQSARWASNFAACCRDLLGATVAGRVVRYRGRTTRLGVYPVGVDPRQLRREASHDDVAAEAESLQRLVRDRLVFLRVDRTEPTKNIVRGFSAFERLLETRPDLRERVVQLALLTPSRSRLPEYRAYLAACHQRAAEINDRFATAGWTPIRIEIEDNLPRTLAAYRRYDVLVCNSIYDGMNLIAREGPILNERDGALVLSRNAGAAAELGEAALLVNPFDIEQTADAYAAAVDMAPGDRRDRAGRLRRLAPGMTPDRWLDAQLRDLER